MQAAACYLEMSYRPTTRSMTLQVYNLICIQGPLSRILEFEHNTPSFIIYACMHNQLEWLKENEHTNNNQPNSTVSLDTTSQPSIVSLLYILSFLYHKCILRKYRNHESPTAPGRCSYRSSIEHW